MIPYIHMFVPRGKDTIQKFDAQKYFCYDKNGVYQIIRGLK